MRSAIAGLGAVTACAVAVTVLGFGTEAPLAVVLVVSAFFAAAVSAIAFYGLIRPILTDLESARVTSAIAQQRLAIASTRRTFLEQLDVMLDSAETEDEAIAVVGRALSVVVPERDNAVLLAPPTGGRVTWLVEADPDGLGTPTIFDEALSCGALIARQSTRAATSEAPDACEHLASHGWEVSSLCVPILVGDHHLGVAHSAGPAGDLPDNEAISLLEAICRRVGARIVALRAARRFDYTLPLDSVTQLPTHSLVFREVRQLRSEATLFALAVCDLDDFAGYNDEWGNEVGDQALRTFADVLSATLRPTDIIARYEGDRFVCLFPNTAPLHAAGAMERVRESLILHTAMTELPPFNASVGIVGSFDAETSEELVNHAITALATAKVDGGNRVVCVETLADHTPVDPQRSA